MKSEQPGTVLACPECGYAGIQDYGPDRHFHCPDNKHGCGADFDEPEPRPDGRSETNWLGRPAIHPGDDDDYDWDWDKLDRQEKTD